MNSNNKDVVHIKNIRTVSKASHGSGSVPQTANKEKNPIKTAYYSKNLKVKLKKGGSNFNVNSASGSGAASR